MRSNFLNIALFLVVAVGLWFGLSYLDKRLPKPPNKNEVFEKLREEAEKEKEQRLRDEALAKEQLHLEEQKRENRKLALGSLAGWAAASAEAVPRPAEKLPTTREAAMNAVTGSAATSVPPSKDQAAKTPAPPKPPAPPRQPGTLISLGDSSYNLNVMLTTTGGAVQQVILTKFDAANRLGREVKQKDASGNPTQQGVPLYLIPGKALYDRKDLQAEYIPPVLTPGPIADPTVLSEPSYAIYHYPTRDDNYPDPFLGETNWKLVSQDHPAGGEHTVVFEMELGDPYLVRFRKTYTLSPGDYHIGFKLEIERLPGGQKGKGQLRYQIAGPHGLPLEGEWYATTPRVALIGWTDSKGTSRRQYDDAAGVAIQRGGDKVQNGPGISFKYMAVSTQFMASAVAIDDTAEGSAKNPWAYVRSTTETPLTAQPNPNTLNFEDITVRAASEIIDLEPGKTLTHKYILYNGPSKVRLLGLLEGDRAVSPQLVQRYQDQMGLRTITDFHSPSSFGAFANAIWWSDIVQAFDNLMHWLLWAIHYVIGSWGMSIVVLTVFVRLILFFPSRKQTRMNLRMMEIQNRLAPQVEELKRRYADDYGTFNREKMRLMVNNGINPATQLGGCLLLLVQTPLMMGLYFCLQESIFFRLDHFLWIDNMAAPDMTLWWSEKIPFISTPSDMGGMLYLGPYLNVLPILAAGLMIYQQQKAMPPALDEQTRQSQNMMKYMMVFFGIMFYKVAAGLALYFIVGSTWGLIERSFFKIRAAHAHAAAENNGDATTSSGYGSQAGSGDNRVLPATEEKSQGAFGRLRSALQERLDEMKRQADEQSRRQIRNKPDQDRGDRKKKRRK